MKMYTAHVTQHRLADKMNIPFVDVTVKSGERTFSPTWDMVMGYKAGTIPEGVYSSLYTDLMRESYKVYMNRWLEVANMESIVLACYCKGGHFCHRLLLKDMFEKICLSKGIPFIYLGELSGKKVEEIV